jgi:uncharacterized protein (TIGR03435 family)
MKQFAENLAEVRDLARPVVDKTGIEGVFDIRLEWTPLNGDAGQPVTSTDDSASVFAALQEQLGLRVQAQKVPTEVLVVDHLEQPSEN